MGSEAPSTPEKSERLAQMSPVKQALFELREMRTRLEAVEAAKTEPIAIIGMSCRFPGDVKSVADYWQLLMNGVDAITEVPPDRWDIDSYYDPDPDAAGKIYTRYGGFLTGVDQFDPQFFGISPREADNLDPQHRFLLEVSWEALENAGQAPDMLTGNPTGVFVGISNNDYQKILVGGDQKAIDVYLATGTTQSAAVGRISYILGVEGPAIALDTACSSSLVAVHLAVQSLRNGECQMALAGGVNVILLPEVLINFSRARMISADGRCKTFDSRANGFVRSEGCGIVVLKRYSDAIKNNDHILALIRGTAVNQDGRSSGLTAPNGLSQEAVIRTALANGGLTPKQVSYVEAHGTGTSLGDPIEINALNAALCSDRTTSQPLLVGSAKTNIGHLESAAGVAGLMKTVLILQHKTIPPHLHLQSLNPHIDWEKMPIGIPTQSTPLPPIDGKYIAGVSSFGFSGTNSHVVLEAAPEQGYEARELERPLHMLTLSAKQEASLRGLGQQFVDSLTEYEDSFADVCFTANSGRGQMTHRVAVISANPREARQKLTAFLNGEETPGVFHDNVAFATHPEIAFLFTGHGSHYADMGRQLFETQPTFRTAIEQCADLLRAHMDQPLLSVLFPETENAQWMNQMTYAQPALFALEFALAKLWRSWGIEPTMVLGHSVGEYVAACVAGIFSLEDGLKLVAKRGHLMDSLPMRGEMVAVIADENTVAEAVAPYAEDVSIAVINGPQNIVISGASEAIQKIVAGLKEKRIKSLRLAVAQAAHSHFLDPILDEFEETASQVTYHKPKIGLVSGMTAEIVAHMEASTPKYWRRHLRQTVRFADAMQTLYQAGTEYFLEIGPNPTLLGMGRRCLPDEAGVWLPSLRQGWDEWGQMLESLATIYTHGARVDWSGFDKDYTRKRLPLPTYPWSHQRYWTDQQPREGRSTPITSLWQSVLTSGQHQAMHAPFDLAVHTYQSKWQQLDKLVLAYITKTLRDLGAFTKSGQAYSPAAFMSAFQILPAYKDLVSRWLQRLTGQGLLSYKDGAYRADHPLPDPDLANVWEVVAPQLADLPPLLEYVQRAGQNLTVILTGEKKPLEILFPGGSFETFDFIYRDWPLIGYFHGLIQALLQTFLLGTQSKGALRILEIGGGSGSSVQGLLPFIQGIRANYLYTEASEVFLHRAQDQLSSYPFVQLGILDIDQALEDQGYQPNQFDAIIASSALYVAGDLDAAITNLHKLLAPGGYLFIYETTTHLSWFDMGLGLVEAWGSYQDVWRQDAPILSLDKWQQLLHSHGFNAVAAFPTPDSAATILGGHVFVAHEGSEPVETYHADGRASAQEIHPEIASKPDTVRAEETNSFVNGLIATLPDVRQDMLIAYVRQHVAQVLRMDQQQQIDRRHRLMDLGVDSLMAVDLKNRLQKGLGLAQSLPATLIFDYPNIEAIAGYLDMIISQYALSEEPDDLLRPSKRTKAAAEAEPQEAAQIEELSDAEVESLLLKKLMEIQDEFDD